MIRESDEFLHEFVERNGFIESYSFNFVDKKSRIFGCADIDFNFDSGETEFIWVVFFNGEVFTYSNTIDFDEKYKKSYFNDKGLLFRVINPFKNFELLLKNELITIKMSLVGVSPIFVFPSSHVDSDRGKDSLQMIRLCNRYSQRCSISGEIRIRGGVNKGARKGFSCYGERQHSYGKQSLNRINCSSNLIIQLSDGLMNLSYMEVDGATLTSGFISRRIGNNPIEKTGLELISYNCDGGRFNFLSSEFSYREAQDDIDLVVSKKIYMIEMSLEKNLRRKYIKFRSFSDFAFIGANKNGVGLEEHFVPFDRLEEMNS